MKRILVIGIGAGDPRHITVQAMEAMAGADVFFVMDKGPEKDKLAALRRDLLRRYAGARPYRVVEAPVPVRDGGAADYRAAVADLNRDKGELYGRLIAEELKDGECGAFLVWGDPSLYDSTIRILHRLVDEGRHGFGFEVIPGITSVQALAARHRTTLNQVGEAFAVTTGRRLADGFPDGVGSAVVMLDAHATFRRFADQDIDIFWGAYVGTPD
jgi:precorrin-6A synthase